MSISQEGKNISKTFAGLREFGFLVYNFNTPSKMREGQGKLCDHIVLGDTGLHFLEVKLFSTADKMKPKQKLFSYLIKSIADKCIWVNYYILHTLDDAQVAYESILNGTESQEGERLDGRQDKQKGKIS